MKIKWFYVILFLQVMLFWQCQPREIDIFLIGDSTMADKPLEGNPERGWGQLLPTFFNENVSIKNHARNGRSTKSFIDEGRWQTVYDSIAPADYVFIQFGHNDQKEYDSTRYTAPWGQYRANLEKFVIETREKGGQPILLTPIVRRRFDANGNFYDTHGEYPDVVREVAEEMDVPLIDIHQASRDLLVSVGVEESKELFVWVEPGEYPRFLEGRKDNTHFSVYGAQEMARLVVDEIKTQKLKLKKYLK